MNALNRNLITCAWPDSCTQQGTDIILLIHQDKEYGIEFCPDHAGRVLAVNPLSRRESDEEDEAEPILT